MNVKILDFPKIVDKRGNLTFLQNPQFIPFEIKRIFWLYNVPEEGTTKGCAYKEQEEVIIALSGSFTVTITQKDGSSEYFTLNRSNKGLFIPTLTWRHIENFSTNAVALCLSNKIYSIESCIDNLETFKNIKLK